MGLYRRVFRKLKLIAKLNGCTEIYTSSNLLTTVPTGYVGWNKSITIYAKRPIDVLVLMAHEVGHIVNGDIEWYLKNGVHAFGTVSVEILTREWMAWEFAIENIGSLVPLEYLLVIRNWCIETYFRNYAITEGLHEPEKENCNTN